MFKIDKFKRQFPKFCHVEQVFSKEEVKRIYDLEDLEKFRRGMVGSNNSEGEVKLESRDSEIMWVNPDKPEENALLWLENGASKEKQRQLGH